MCNRGDWWSVQVGCSTLPDETRKTSPLLLSVLFKFTFTFLFYTYLCLFLGNNNKQSGDYSKHAVAATISPSMDICVSSNFERYLFHLGGDNAKELRSLMEAFESKKVGEAASTSNGSKASPGE